jgi:hypothetical protein
MSRSTAIQVVHLVKMILAYHSLPIQEGSASPINKKQNTQK